MGIADKTPPKDWPRISASLTYDQPAKAIDWLCAAFGFEVRLKIDGEGGRIEHSELTLGGGLIMIGSGNPLRDSTWRQSPKLLGGANTANLMVFVDDVDAHCERARAAGARIASEPKTTDYGAEYWSDRTYEAVDLEGHHWWFVQRIR